jgi:hypothetical protein
VPSTSRTTEVIHRYTCTIHDGEQCDGHCAVTPEAILSYADIITDVSGKQPATSLPELADQLDVSYMRMEDAGIDGADDVGWAAVFVGEAADTTGIKQALLLKKARDRLTGLRDMVGQYRDAD